MLKKQLLIILLIIGFIQACENKYNNKTKIFNDYLEKNRNGKIPSAEHIYLINCKYGCIGCVLKAIDKIDEKVTSDLTDKITFYTYDVKMIPVSLRKKTKIILVENASYENIGLPIANITLIKTDQEKIVKIRVMNLDEIDAIVNEEF